MKFDCSESLCILQGILPRSIQVMIVAQSSKCFTPSDQFWCPCIMLMTSTDQLSLQATGSQTHVDIQNLLEDFSDIFGVYTSLPPARAQDHKIPLKDENTLIKIRPYRYPTVQKAEIEKIIQEMLHNREIRDSTSSFSSPIVMVKIKDDNWKLYVDYRQLNQLTIKDKFPIPIIEELLDELSHAKVFSKLDLRSRYHQIRMNEDDIHKTAFRTHEEHYEFLIMPFRLTNAPSNFQALMNIIFEPLLRKSVLVFFYDILVFSTSWEEHLDHL